MDAQTLRELQAPIKEKYKADPQAALIMLHAESTLTKAIAVEVNTSIGTVTSGLHPATGGSGMEACSGDMLLQALAACAGVTLNVVATAMGIELRNASVKVNGLLDFRGTLGVSREVPVGFKSIALEFILDTDAAQELVEKLIMLTERYCVVYQSLNVRPELTATITRV